MPTNASGPNDRIVGIDHLTLLQVSPPDLIAIASETGFDAIGIRVGTAGPGEEPYPMAVGSPMLEETLRRMEDTSVRVLDVEVIRLGLDTTRKDYEALLESEQRLEARFINVMGDDEDIDRISDSFARLTADARPFGLRPLIEPMAYRSIHNLEIAVRIAERSDGGGVLVDCMHLQRCGDNLTYLRSVDPALLPQPEARGVLLCDQRIRTTYVVAEPFPNAGGIDRFAEAAAAGAHFTSADTLEELASQVAQWGVDTVQLLATVQAYIAAARGEPVSLDAPLPATPEPLTEPPFYALEVVPSITFTYGGLRNDLEGRVLDHNNVPVAGLWVGGVDAGGLSNWTYAGGLAAAYFTGRRAGASAAK